MHSPEYTKKIKALLAAREELTLNLNSCVYSFRNGRKPYAENVEQAKKAFKEVMEILEGQDDTTPGKGTALEGEPQDEKGFFRDWRA